MITLTFYEALTELKHNDFKGYLVSSGFDNSFGKWSSCIVKGEDTYFRNPCLRELLKGNHGYRLSVGGSAEATNNILNQSFVFIRTHKELFDLVLSCHNILKGMTRTELEEVLKRFCKKHLISYLEYEELFNKVQEVYNGNNNITV